jgi:hypothetical protein
MEELLPALLYRVTAAALLLVSVPVVYAADAASIPDSKATLIVGEGAKHNTHGTLSADADGMRFVAKSKTYTFRKSLLQKVTAGSDSRETGGLPTTAIKTAVPYGGGRVISLFAHEKIDTLTVEYRDDNGGYHGAVFMLPKGQSEAMAAAAGAITASNPPKPTPSADGVTGPGWAIEVEPLDAGDTAISPAFLLAAYEFLIEKLEQSHKFATVLRAGDVNAAKHPKLLILKTRVIDFVHGSEEARAVTTVKGWTKLRVNMDLQTSDGRPVLQKEVQSNVRLYGGNMRATQTLAASMTNLAATAKVPE